MKSQRELLSALNHAGIPFGGSTCFSGTNNDLPECEEYQNMLGGIQSHAHSTI